MRAFLSFLLLLLTAGLSYGQTLLTESIEPQIGDNWMAWTLDTSGLSEGFGGTTQIWDFSQAIIRDSLQAEVLAVSSTPEPDSFPNSDLAILLGFAEYKFYDTLGTSFSYHGNYNASSGIGVPYSDGQDRLDFPLSFGKAWQDNFSGKFTAFGSTHFISGNITAEVDGEGIIKLPDGSSVNNVLRIRLLESLKDSAGSGGSWSVTTSQNRYYQWWTPGRSFPLLEMEFVEALVSGNVVQIQKAWWFGERITGTASGPMPFRLKAWPNPGGDRLFIELPASHTISEVSVFSLNGALHLSQKYPAGSSGIELSTRTLPAGTYLLRIRQGELQTSQLWQKK